MLSKLIMELEKLQSNLDYSLAAPANIENISLVKKWISDNVTSDLWFSEYENFLSEEMDWYLMG